MRRLEPILKLMEALFSVGLVIALNITPASAQSGAEILTNKSVVQLHWIIR